MKKTLLFVIGIIFMLKLYSGNKSYQFSYDANGNRVTVSFSSTCNATRYAQPGDSILVIDSLLNMDSLVQARQLMPAMPAGFPNPMREYFILTFPVLENIAQMIIYDVNGLEVYRDDRINTAYNIITTCGLSAGMYTVVVHVENEKPFVQKIIKQ